MQVSKISNFQKPLNDLQSKISNPIRKVIEKAAKQTTLKTLAVTAAASSGAYIVTKSAQTRQEKIDILKELKLNDTTINKVLNAKDEDGNVVFNKRNLKALKETAEAEDTTFFNHVMKNIDNINYFHKITDSKHNTKIYEMSAKTPDGTDRYVQMIVAPEEIDTDLTDTQGKRTKTVMRTFTDDSIEESIRETELVTKTIKRKNRFKKIEEEKTITDELVSYTKANNKFMREVHDDDAFGYNKQTKIIKFNSQGVIDNRTVTDANLEEIRKIKNGKYKKEDLERILGRELDFDEFRAIKSGDFPQVLVEKILNNKSITKDYKNNAIIKADGGATPDMMTAQTRTYINPRTGRKETIKMELSDVKGVYNSTITDDLGNTRVESRGTKDLFGNIKVEKNFESLDGTKTHYTYSADKNENNIKMHYQIVDENGKVLTTVDRTFNRVNPNLAYSSINGHSYVIEKKAKSFEVTDNLNGQKTEIKFKDIFKNSESRKHPELLDKLSGDMLLDMYNRHYKYEYSKEALESYMDNEDVYISTKDDVFVFNHEQGHTKDVISSYDPDYIEENDDIDKDYSKASDFDGEARISTNPQLRKVYEQERADFMRAFPDIEQGYIDYFIDRVSHYGGYLGGAMETVAETNALLSTDTGFDILSARGYYLQKFFPRTIAALSRLEMPNSNLYLNNNVK